MSDVLTVGSLVDPLSGRTWDPAAVRRQVAHRRDRYEQMGVGRSDRLFFHSANTLEFFVDLLAVWRLGACVVPIDGRLSSFEIETLARAARPRFSLWNGRPDAGVADPLVRLGTTVIESPSANESGDTENGTSPFFDQPDALDQSALILFTSGTTGEPKGVVHSHGSLHARWSALREHLGVQSFKRTLCLLPTHFGHGLICNCLFPWLAGQDLYILPPFRADLLMRLGRLIDDHRITFMSSVPAMWRLTLKTAKPPRSQSLERVFCGSAPLSASLWTSIQNWTGANEVFNVYGITETASWLAGTSGTDAPEDGLVGEAWGGSIKILHSGDVAVSPESAAECAPGESGYVWVKTPALMKGYLDKDDLTNQVVSCGWFLTKDIGFLDQRGRLHLSRREREEINKAGMKVYPTDIDTVIEGFANTVDVCTFAYDDALQGEDVGVAVVLDPDNAGTRRELYEWTRQHLGKHQFPRRWYVVGEIPRTSRGKVNRAHTAQRCARLAPSEMRDGVDPVRKRSDGEE